MSTDELHDHIISALKKTHDDLVHAFKLAQEAGMKEILTTWNDEHTTQLNAMSGIAMQTLGEMPDQAYHFTRGTDCKIVRTQKKNAKSRSLPTGNHVRAKKKKATQKGNH